VISKGQITLPKEIRNKLGLSTGDRDFLESDVTNPKIMTAAEFIE
jgi:AbrB family looped-hinge helix DNA binding protein